MDFKAHLDLFIAGQAEGLEIRINTPFQGEPSAEMLRDGESIATCPGSSKWFTEALDVVKRRSAK